MNQESRMTKTVKNRKLFTLHDTKEERSTRTDVLKNFNTFSQELLYLWLVELPSFLLQEQEPWLLVQIPLALLELNKILL